MLDRAVDQVLRTAGIEVVENDGALRSRFRIRARVQELFAIVGKSEVRSGGRGNFFEHSATHDDFPRGIEVGHGRGRLETGDGSFESRFLFGGVVGILVVLVGDAGE